MGSRKKAGKYKGVFQRANGTWYYRYKRIVDGQAVNFQESGFDTEEDARKGLIDFMYTEEYQENYNEIITTIHFQHAFQLFIKDKVKSESSKKKYQAIYDAQLVPWENKIIGEMKDSDIDLLLLRLCLKQREKVNARGEVEKNKYSESYISSVRKLVMLIFKYAFDRGFIHENFTIYFAKRPYKLRVMTLFSGIGAPERALSNMGIDYDLVNFCEIDDKAAKAYCLIHKVDEAKRMRDVQEMVKRDIRQYPRFDLLFFGFPCQDISTAGKQKGLRDEDGEKTRSGLFFDAMEIASHEMPKFIIVENVSALVSNRHQKDFEIILQTMNKAGYEVRWQRLNAKKYGVPQNRNRVFLVLIRRDMNIDFHFPEETPLTVNAKDWYLDNVDEEYYVDMSKDSQLIEELKTNYNFNRPVIRCITTPWGAPSYHEQTFIKDKKGIRCLSSEELMKFQGFKESDGTLLRNEGFAKGPVGTLVGNSICVPVLELIFKQLFDAL